jgi:RNA polymerase sigma factor (sigma-70 family)
VSDAALLTRPKTDRAFERLYTRHVHDVYRYVLAVLRNPADAEDVTQATFLNAFRAFQRGDRPELARNWLLKIAHNECRQRFRMLSRRPKEVLWDERAAAPPIDESVPTADEIRQALGHLSFNQRSALVMRELEGRSYGEIGEILDLSNSAVETLIFRARRALREQLEGGLSCGEAEAALSKRLDGTLAPSEQRALRAHLRECTECATLERKQRAQRAALKRLSVVQLPPSLAGFVGGGAGSTVGGIVAGSGIAAKAAAMVAAGVIAGGVGHQAVEAVAAREPNRTELPTLSQLPRAYPQVFASTAAIRNSKQAEPGTGVSFAPVDASAVRAAVGKALARPGTGASTSQPSAGTAGPGTAGPSAGQPAASATAVAKNAAQPVRAVVETATTVVKEVTKAPLPTPPPVEVPPPPAALPPVPPLSPLPPLPPPPALPPPPPVPLPPPLPGSDG